MTKLSYLVTDVFTDQAFGGNPLAVFFDCDDVSTDKMQQIAREMNLAETVFVCSSDKPDAWARLRIFTTEEELPFAGHPNVGTAAALVYKKILPPSLIVATIDSFKSFFDEKVGKVGIAVSRNEQQLVYAELTAAVPSSLQHSVIDSDKYAMILGLKEADIHPHIPIYVGNAGLDFGIVPVASKVAITKAEMNNAGWNTWLKSTNAKFTYLVFIEPESAHIHARMFCPSLGVVEDPATGSAAAALSGLLAKHYPQFDSHDSLYSRQKWVITQGVKIGRPSRIELSFSIDQGRAVDIKVGGTSVIMAEGTFMLH